MPRSPPPRFSHLNISMGVSDASSIYNSTTQDDTTMRHLTPPEAATILLRIKPNAADMSPGWEVELPSPGSARARPLIGADARTRTWQTKGAWVYGRVAGERAAAAYVWLV